MRSRNVVILEESPEARLPEAGGFPSPLGAREASMEPRALIRVAKGEGATGMATFPGVAAPVATPATEPFVTPAASMTLPWAVAGAEAVEDC